MAATNLVSAPPLTAPVVDQGGRISKPWAIWFRDVYRRTSFKGGNAIDDNVKDVTAVVIAVNANAASITLLSTDLTNLTAVQSTHAGLATAHGANGAIVGKNDTATNTVNGLVKRMAALSDAVNTTVTVTVANASTAPAAYDQAYAQSIADLSNANKAAINQIAIDLNAAIGVLNGLITSSKSSGQMAP
jgi:hypothetical protein